MTLGEKLEELGYRCDNPYFRYWKYYYDINVSVAIFLELGLDIVNYGIDTDADLYQQEDIDNMQIAFNRLKKDLKEIEKWQKQVAKLSK